MTYLLIKALHVCAIIVWTAGMVLQSLALQLIRAAQDSNSESLALQLLRSWDRFATTPALLLAWVTGLTLATQGGWFGNRWLFLKLALVVALSGMHGVLAGRLRAHIEARSTRPAPPLRLLLPGLFVIVAGIVLLVITKPF